MTVDWRAVDAALERHTPTLWWRDDDAVAPTPALDRLIGLAAQAGAPLTLAVIPQRATEALARRIETEPVTAAVHGWAHTNHAPPTEKKAEFGAHRSLDTLAEDSTRGKARIDALFGAQALPLFVPPWNRMADAMPGLLTEQGFQAVSCFAQRDASRPAPELLRIDAHVDPIDWRGSRSAVDAQALVDHLAGLLRSRVPVGLMTHHLVHDEAVWALTEALVTRLSRNRVHWTDIRSLIEPAVSGASPESPLT